MTATVSDCCRFIIIIIIINSLLPLKSKQSSCWYRVMYVDIYVTVIARCVNIRIDALADQDQRTPEHLTWPFWVQMD